MENKTNIFCIGSQTLEAASTTRRNATSSLLTSSSSVSTNSTTYPSLTPDIFFEKMPLQDAVTNQAIRHISDPISIAALAICLMFSLAL
jgi:hypothetical protein